MLDALKMKILRRETRPDKLLAFLYHFDNLGIREISITELLYAVRNAQQKKDFGYRFSDKIFYSSDVFDELNRLQDEGYIKRYSYKYDGYFPMNYVALTPTGFKQSKKVAESISPEEADIIHESVKNAIHTLKEMYRIWSRKLPTRETFSQYLQSQQLSEL